MKLSNLHHVSVVTKDLPRSIAFYRDVMGLKQIERPAFKTSGAWFSGGSLEVHLIGHGGGTFRQSHSIDTGDGHFAIRVADFEDAMKHFAAKGFREELADGDPKQIYINRKSITGYPQAYLLDPDSNIIEINGAP